jgi:hypothetical protein
VEIVVRIKVKASQNKLVRNPDGTFTAYLTAPPVKGQANRSLVELLSDKFNVAKSYIQIVKGMNSKNKIISIGKIKCRKSVS